MGATLSERYEMKDKGTKKLMTDYERLRKDLTKEQESNEKYKVALNSARLTSEQQAKTIEELKARLDIAESKSSTAQLDHKGWKAAVVTKISEEKNVRLTSDLEAKVNNTEIKSTLLSVLLAVCGSHFEALNTLICKKHSWF